MSSLKPVASTLSDAIVKVLTHRAKKELSDATSENNKKTEIAEAELIEVMNGLGCSSIRSDEFLCTITKKVSHKYSFLVGNKELVFDWLRNLGKDDVIKDSVNAQTFKALVNEMFDSGEITELPVFVSHFPELGLSIRFN